MILKHQALDLHTSNHRDEIDSCFNEVVVGAVPLNFCQILPSGLNVQGTEKLIGVKRCCAENILDDVVVLDLLVLGLSLGLFVFSFRC